LDNEVGDDVSQIKNVPGLFAARIDQKVLVEDYKAGIIANAEKSVIRLIWLQQLRRIRIALHGGNGCI
jgi:anion-transporting  ArsA/GET3 family ATPase